MTNRSQGFKEDRRVEGPSLLVEIELALGLSTLFGGMSPTNRGA